MLYWRTPQNLELRLHLSKTSKLVWKDTASAVKGKVHISTPAEKQHTGQKQVVVIATWKWTRHTRSLRLWRSFPEFSKSVMWTMTMTWCFGIVPQPVAMTALATRVTSSFSTTKRVGANLHLYSSWCLSRLSRFWSSVRNDASQLIRSKVINK